MHEQKSFYKYMTFDTALAVLENCSLRWSSPLIFNDPFDVPREVMSNVTSDKISKSLVKLIINELKNPRRDLDELHSNIKNMIIQFKTMFPQGIPEELMDKFDSIMGNPPIGDGAEQSIDDFKIIWESMIKRMRILCLTINPAITSMWNHYADHYSGVVLEFSCNDELDSAWLIAEPIIYSNDLPHTYSADGMAHLLFHNEKKSIKYLAHEITYLKTKDWSTEQEWRISTYDSVSSDNLFSDLKFHPLELKSVILGPNFKNENFDKLLELLVKYKHTVIKTAEITAQRNIAINVKV